MKYGEENNYKNTNSPLKWDFTVQNKTRIKNHTKFKILVFLEEKKNIHINYYFQMTIHQF